MTAPANFTPYPDELAKIAIVMTKLSNAFDFSHFTETNKAIFDMAAHEEFAKIGITIRVNWQEIYRRTGLMADEGESTGVWLPGIEPIGRIRKEQETDHERIQWGVVKGLDGGEKGYIRADGTKHEDPIRKVIT